MTLPVHLPLLPLLEETVLPGEERAVLPSWLPDGGGPWLLALEPGARFVLLPVTAFAEVPHLLPGRFATQVVCLEREGEHPRVLGEARVRLVSARGERAPYEAELRMPEPPVQDDSARLPATLLKAVAALCHGPPRFPGTDLRPLAAMALRLLGGASACRLAVSSGDLERFLESASASFMEEAAGREVVLKIEEQIAALAAKPRPSKPLKQQIAGALQEIQRRLSPEAASPPTEAAVDELELARRSIEQGRLPPEALAAAESELKLMREMKKDNHDYATHLRLLSLMGKLSWHPDKLPPVDLAHVKRVLDGGHAGLEKAKQRIVEYLAVRALGGKGRATVLCLTGPPGVGKTSVSRAMAEALGRPFVRISLGGVHDECELRGHRITFSAARPGRVIEGLAKVRSCSALVLLDELDKIGTDRARDAIGPLLEILDPEQNHAFSDNFLSVPYDLSDCLFVTTANDASRLPDFLLDRLESIPIEGYSTQEKTSIAISHLASELASEHGLPPLPIDGPVLVEVIEGWTREAGVRQLRQKLAALYREQAVLRVTDPAQAALAPRPVGTADLPRVLGPRRFHPPDRLLALPPGVATGLSVSAHGGQTLPLEVVRLGVAESALGGLAMTGSLGAVMKESAELVRAHLMAYRARYGLAEDVFRWDLHLHAPEAAIPKDGPSAGVALFLALLSLYSGRTVCADVAITGELGLSGQVLAVGGIRAKCLAAERAGMRQVLLPRANQAEVPADLAITVTPLVTAEDALCALGTSAALTTSP
jgi:ATP-dependent Lon protease